MSSYRGWSDYGDLHQNIDALQQDLKNNIDKIHVLLSQQPKHQQRFTQSRHSISSNQPSQSTNNHNGIKYVPHPDSKQIECRHQFISSTLERRPTLEHNAAPGNVPRITSDKSSGHCDRHEVLSKNKLGDTSPLQQTSRYKQYVLSASSNGTEGNAIDRETMGCLNDQDRSGDCLLGNISMADACRHVKTRVLSSNNINYNSHLSHKAQDMNSIIKENVADYTSGKSKQCSDIEHCLVSNNIFRPDSTINIDKSINVSEWILSCVSPLKMQDNVTWSPRTDMAPGDIGCIEPSEETNNNGSQNECEIDRGQNNNVKNVTKRPTLRNRARSSSVGGKLSTGTTLTGTQGGKTLQRPKSLSADRSSDNEKRKDIFRPKSSNIEKTRLSPNRLAPGETKKTERRKSSTERSKEIPKHKVGSNLKNANMENIKTKLSPNTLGTEIHKSTENRTTVNTDSTTKIKKGEVRLKPKDGNVETFDRCSPFHFGKRNEQSDASESKMADSPALLADTLPVLKKPKNISNKKSKPKLKDNPFTDESKMSLEQINKTKIKKIQDPKVCNETIKSYSSEHIQLIDDKNNPMKETLPSNVKQNVSTSSLGTFIELSKISLLELINGPVKFCHEHEKEDNADYFKSPIFKSLESSKQHIPEVWPTQTDSTETLEKICGDLDNSGELNKSSLPCPGEFDSNEIPAETNKNRDINENKNPFKGNNKESEKPQSKSKVQSDNTKDKGTNSKEKASPSAASKSKESTKTKDSNPTQKQSEKSHTKPKLEKTEEKNKTTEKKSSKSSGGKSDSKTGNDPKKSPGQPTEDDNGAKHRSAKNTLLDANETTGDETNKKPDPKENKNDKSDSEEVKQSKPGSIEMTNKKDKSDLEKGKQSKTGSVGSNKSNTSNKKHSKSVQKRNTNDRSHSDEEELWKELERSVDAQSIYGSVISSTDRESDDTFPLTEDDEPFSNKEKKKPTRNTSNHHSTLVKQAQLCLQMPKIALFVLCCIFLSIILVFFLQSNREMGATSKTASKYGSAKKSGSHPPIEQDEMATQDDFDSGEKIQVLTALRRKCGLTGTFFNQDCSLVLPSETDGE